jgi:hypothetical protein
MADSNNNDDDTSGQPYPVVDTTNKTARDDTAHTGSVAVNPPWWSKFLDAGKNVAKGVGSDLAAGAYDVGSGLANTVGGFGQDLPYLNAAASPLGTIASLALGGSNPAQQSQAFNKAYATQIPGTGTSLADVAKYEPPTGAGKTMKVAGQVALPLLATGAFGMPSISGEDLPAVLDNLPQWMVKGMVRTALGGTEGAGAGALKYADTPSEKLRNIGETGAAGAALGAANPETLVEALGRRGGLPQGVTQFGSKVAHHLASEKLEDATGSAVGAVSRAAQQPTSAISDADLQGIYDRLMRSVPHGADTLAAQWLANGGQ